MTIPDAPSDFLVEWYQPGPAAAALPDAADRLTRAAARPGDRRPVTLTILITIPTDRTLFAVFTAHHPDEVTQVCARAGWPADRITAHVHTWTPGADVRGQDG